MGKRTYADMTYAEIMLGARERILSKCLNVDDPDACWEFTGNRACFGHGMLFFRGAAMHASRVMLATYGAPVDDCMVCHRCGNPPCCNPKHLYLGTQQDNMDDMISHGNTVAKLSSEQVRAIRERAASASNVVVADEFGISSSHVSNIALRKNWAHVEDLNDA